MKKIILAIVLLGFVTSGCVATTTYVKATDIQKISLGDTFDMVKEKIGEPNQVVSKKITKEDKEEVVWLYEAVRRPYDPERIIKPSPDDMAKWEKIYQTQSLTNPPYLVIFIDGKVSEIKRQK